MVKEKTLQELLDEKGITQVSLMPILNLSEPQISLLVNGKRRMSLEVAVKIAKKLRVSINTIFLAIDFAKRKEKWQDVE